jgi:uncharacterized membrane protein
MLKTVTFFLRNHGFKILLIGFGITAVFMISYIYCINKHLSLQLRSYTFFATFVGMGIIAVGRLGVFLENRARKKAEKEPEDTTNKDIL